MPIARHGSPATSRSRFHAIERLEHYAAAAKRVGSIVAGRLGHPEHRENLVADIFFDRAAAGENLCRHAVVSPGIPGADKRRFLICPAAKGRALKPDIHVRRDTIQLIE